MCRAGCARGWGCAEVSYPLVRLRYLGGDCSVGMHCSEKSSFGLNNVLCLNFLNVSL